MRAAVGEGSEARAGRCVPPKGRGCSGWCRLPAAGVCMLVADASWRRPPAATTCLSPARRCLLYSVVLLGKEHLKTTAAAGQRGVEQGIGMLPLVSTASKCCLQACKCEGLGHEKRPCPILTLHHLTIFSPLGRTPPAHSRPASRPATRQPALQLTSRQLSGCFGGVALGWRVGGGAQRALVLLALIGGQCQAALWLWLEQGVHHSVATILCCCPW